MLSISLTKELSASLQELNQQIAKAYAKILLPETDISLF
jgi:hypothetical protein